MTPDVLKALASQLGARTKAYVAAALVPVLERLTALETKAAIPGPAGERGEKGLDGAPGAAGERGERGPEGPQGPAGEKGADGQDGAPGRDGRDGQPGVPGATGEKGLDGTHGKDGRDGVDGKDGLGFDDMQVEHDGERAFSFKFVRGDRVKTFGAFTVPAQIYRGVFEAAKAYSYQDAVTWAGSQWVCMAEKATGKPGEPQSGWVLAVKRGADGKQGPAGPQGEKGLRGESGPQGRDLRYSP